MVATIPEQTTRWKSLFAAETLEEVNGRMALLRRIASDYGAR
jgi:hypothetical protein